jgi:hypothetical protein
VAASLHVAVQLEVADRRLLQPGQLGVTVDLLLADGTPLLQDLPTKLDEVREGSSCIARLVIGGALPLGVGVDVASLPTGQLIANVTPASTVRPCQLVQKPSDVS